MKKIIYTAVVLFTMMRTSVAQELPAHKWNFNLGIGYLNTKLRNENIKEDETLITRSENHPVIEVNASRLLGDHFSFTAGLMLHQYSLFSSCEGIFVSSALIPDTDGYDYHPYYETDFTIERKITTLGIPVGIKTLIGNPGKTRMQLETGIQTSFAISSGFKQDGHYERKGLYPDHQFINVDHLLEDIPRLNYGYNDLDRDTSLSAKSVLLSYYISAGISAPVSAKVDFYIKGFLTTGLQDITSSEAKTKYTNFMGQSSEYKKTTLFAAGIIAGILLR